MYIFNPENDMALANFSPNYTPPASSVKLAGDLSLLPLWYAPDGSVVMSHEQIDLDFVESAKSRFNIKTSVVFIDEVLQHTSQGITPWGWSPLLKNNLINMGVPQELTPNSDYLALLREYSSRKNAVRLLSELKVENPQFYGSSYYYTDIDSLLDYLATTDGDKALKMPLSGSGRGLIWILDGITDKQTDWARRVVKNQGGVVAEPKLKRVKDFAMEFSLHDGVASFEGYSLFETADSGAYMGNIIMTDDDIENYLAEYVSTDVLHSLRYMLIEKLSAYFPLYNGVLGVDMMICDTDEGYKLQPCVEINIRMNMGLVAHTFYKRFVNKGSKGYYRVDYFKGMNDALLHHEKMLKDFPLIINNGVIQSGYISLTPVNKNTSYVAWVVIGDLNL